MKELLLFKCGYLSISSCKKPLRLRFNPAGHECKLAICQEVWKIWCGNGAKSLKGWRCAGYGIVPPPIVNNICGHPTKDKQTKDTKSSEEIELLLLLLVVKHLRNYHLEHPWDDDRSEIGPKPTLNEAAASAALLTWNPGRMDHDNKWIARNNWFQFIKCCCCWRWSYCQRQLLTHCLQGCPQQQLLR